jgi:tetraacyldisaccharide-1-P 4'-kinase
MEKIPLFTNEAIIITPKDTVKFNKTATLQPWD